MVRVRANAKHTKSQNERGETSNPPTQREIGEGVPLNAPTHREIDRGETSNSASSREIGGEETSRPCPTGGREEIGVTIDPDLLDCSICTDPLCPPLYQCILGHVVCLSCWEKVQKKCPTCKNPRGSRNIALEKVLESIHLPCRNANVGCRKSVAYSQMQVHTDTCKFGKFGPSICPIPGCAHKAFSGEWRQHFAKEHRGAGNYYYYGRSSAIILNEKHHYYTLLGPDKDVCLLVKKPISNFGNVISLFYVDLADRGQNHFSYELEDVTGKSYKFQDIVSINEWKRGKVHGSYSLGVSSKVLLPGYKLRFLINKKRNVSS